MNWLSALAVIGGIVALGYAVYLRIGRKRCELREKLEFRRQHFHHLYSTFRKVEVDDETGQTKNGWEIYLAHVNELDAVLSLLRERND